MDDLIEAFDEAYAMLEVPKPNDYHINDTDYFDEPCEVGSIFEDTVTARDLKFAKE